MTYLYPNLPNWIDPAKVAEYDPNIEWVAERKKNGWRCLAMRTPEGLELWTRRHTLVHDPLPITREALLHLNPGTIIDGELIDKRTKDIKDHYYAFDILMLDGRLTTGFTWQLRRALLEQTLKFIPGIEISEPITVGKSHLYRVAVEQGDEGIVLKNVNSKYLVDYKSCPKNPLWIKAKAEEKAFILT